MFKRGDKVKYLGQDVHKVLDYWPTYPVTEVFGDRILVGCHPNSYPAKDFELKSVTDEASRAETNTSWYDTVGDTGKCQYEGNQRRKSMQLGRVELERKAGKTSPWWVAPASEW